MYGCPYNRMHTMKQIEYCTLTGEATNGVVLCDIDYQDCPQYKNAREPIAPKGPTAIQTSIFGAEGEKPFK